MLFQFLGNLVWQKVTLVPILPKLGKWKSNYFTYNIKGGGHVHMNPQAQFQVGPKWKFSGKLGFKPVPFLSH